MESNSLACHVSAPRAWLWPNLLSLDAPVVAVLWQALFARSFHAGVNPLAAALLVLAVWLIYAADRVLDAWTADSHLPRHEFYRRHWRTVAPVWGVVFAVTGWLAWTRLNASLFERGTVLLAAVAVYFATVHGLRRSFLKTLWPKETAIAVLFALGASLAAWGEIRSAADFAAIFLFSCLCWINCMAIEQWERRSFNHWPIGATAMLVAGGAALLLYDHRPVLGGAEVASALAFVFLDGLVTSGRGQHRLSGDALRVLADVALLSPVVFLPLAGTMR